MQPACRTSHLIWGSSLLILAVFISPVPSVLGQLGGGPSVAEESVTARAKRSSEERLTLEAARRGFEEQLNASEEKARAAADRYREEAGHESPSKEELSRLRKELEAVVSESFKIQMLLQRTRLQIAELNLSDLQAKHARRESLAEDIIQRRVSDLIADDDLAWQSSETPEDESDNGSSMESSAAQDDDSDKEELAIPDFATPRELVNYLREVTKEGDDATKLRRAMKLADEDEVNRMAGAAIRTASMIRSAARIAETFSAFASDGSNAQIIHIGKDLNELLTESRIKKPSRAAQIAFEEITATDISFFQIFAQSSPQPSKPTIDAETYSRKLRLAAQTLKDPAEFIVEFVNIMADLTDGNSANEACDSDAELEIEVDGDHATVRSPLSGIKLPMGNKRMELVKRGNTWKISSTMPDEAIVELQQGLHSGPSPGDSNKSTESPGEDEPASDPESKDEAK